MSKMFDDGVLERNEQIDILKGVLILSVIWGHTATIFSGGTVDSLKNWLNLFFVSFHMPLFIGVSGYLFYSSLKKHSYRSLLSSKFQSTLFPCLIWTLLCAFPACLLSLAKLNFSGVFASILAYRWEYWYIWALLGCILLQMLNWRISRGNIVTCVLLSIFISAVLLLIPIDPIHLFFMWPFFFLGFIFHHIDFKFQKVNRLVTVGIFLAYSVLLLFFDKSHTVYFAPSLLGRGISGTIETIYLYIYRVLIGVCGGYVIAKVVNCFWRSSRFTRAHFFLLKCGKSSLQLYLMHMVTNVYIRGIVNRIVLFLGDNPLTSNLLVYNLVITPALTVCYTQVLLFLIQKLNVWKYTKSWIFGLKCNIFAVRVFKD